MNAPTNLIVFAACLLPSVACGESPARRAVLEVIPAEAWAVAVVHDWPAARRKLEALHIDSLATMNVPLAMAKRAMAIVDGLDEHGSLAVAVMPVAVGAPVADGLLLVLPTVDVAKLMTLWEPEPLGNGVYRVRLMGQVGFVAATAGYALVGPDLEVVQAAARSSHMLASRLRSHLQDRMRRFQIGAWVNSTFVSERGLPMPGLGPESRLAGVGALVAGSCREFMVGLRFLPDGISVDVYLEPNDPVYAALEPSSRPLLAGVSDGEIAFAFSIVNDDRATAVTMFHKTIVAALLRGNWLDSSRASELETHLASMAARTKRLTISAVGPGSGGGGLHAAAVLRSRSTAGMLLGEIRSFARLLKSGPAVDPRFNLLLKALVYRNGVEVIDGVVVDYLRVEFDGDEPVEYEPLRRLLGPEGVLLRLGVVDERHVVLSLGGGVARFQAIVSAVRMGTVAGPTRLAMARAEPYLPADRTMLGYVFPNRLVGLVRALATGSSARLDLPQFGDASVPVGVTLGTAGAGLTWRFVIPMEVLRKPDAPASLLSEGLLPDGLLPAESGEGLAEPKRSTIRN